MLNLFKVLSIVITVAAVTLMAVALATYWVKPDLRAEMNTEAMKNYKFELSSGENPRWTVTRRFSTNPQAPDERSTVGQPFVSGFDALNAAHQDLQRYLSGESDRLSTETRDLIQQTAARKESQLADSTAISEKIDALSQRLEARRGELQQKSEELQAMSVQSAEIREETAARRTDVLRLRHELDEIRTDVYRLTIQRRDLTDRLLRLEIEIHETKDRSSQLSGSGS